MCVYEREKERKREDGGSRRTFVDFQDHSSTNRINNNTGRERKRER